MAGLQLHVDYETATVRLSSITMHEHKEALIAARVSAKWIEFRQGNVEVTLFFEDKQDCETFVVGLYEQLKGEPSDV